MQITPHPRVHIACLWWFLLALVFSLPVSADSGSDWLASQQNTDGVYTGGDGIALDFQSTAEVVRTFVSLGETGRDGIATARTYLDGVDLPLTELLARRLILAVELGGETAEASVSLLALQNSDGGFGDRAGYDSTVLDTAFALESLGLAKVIDEQTAAAAFYLVDQQQAGGAWTLGSDTGSVYVTALAVQALWQYRDYYAVRDAVNLAVDWLLANRDAQSLWGETQDSALALIALLPTFSDKSVIQDSVDALSGLQLADGSWQSDVYKTALALRALAVSQQPYADLGYVRGRILAGDSGLPLEGVLAELNGSASASVTTGPDGVFEFANLPLGTYSLNLSKSGYGALTANLVMDTPRSIDYGDLSMVPLANPTTGSVIGKITDAVTGDPIAEAAVGIQGTSLETLSNSDGQYQITGVAPGSITVTVVKSGYLSVAGSAQLNAGQTLIFSPELYTTGSALILVSGVVSAADGGEPLEGAEVVITQGAAIFGAVTDVQGAYSISGLEPGEFQITVGLAGYQSVFGSGALQSGAHIDFSPSLVEEGQPPSQEPNSGVRGFVVDSVSGQMLEGVNVSLSLDTGQYTAQTDSEGVFSFNSIVAGAGTLSLSMTGYEAIQTQVTLPQNVVLDFGEIPLTPQNQHSTTGFSGLLVDAVSSAPLAGAEVTATFGAETFVLTTDANGLFAQDGITDLGGEVLIALPGYVDITLGVVLQQGAELDLGTLPMRAQDIDNLLPDLSIEQLDPLNMAQTESGFQLQGSIGVTVANYGTAAANAPIALTAFYDSDANGLLDSGEPVFGGNTITSSLDAGETVRSISRWMAPHRSGMPPFPCGWTATKAWWSSPSTTTSDPPPDCVQKAEMPVWIWLCAWTPPAA